MATNVTFEYYNEGPDGRGGKVSAVISLNDVTVNTTPNTTGGWTTASVTADLQRQIFITPAQSVTSGIPSGWYDNAGGAVFQRKGGFGTGRS